MNAPFWTPEEDEMLRAMWVRGVDSKDISRALRAAFGSERSAQAAASRATRWGWKRPAGWAQEQARKGLEAAKAASMRRHATQVATAEPKPAPAPTDDPPPRGWLITEDRARRLFARSGRPEPVPLGTSERMGRMPAFPPVNRSLTGSGFHTLCR